MEQIYCVIPLSKLQIIESKRCRLLELFAVEISVHQGSFQDNSDSAVRLLLTHSFPNKYGANAVHKAQAYIQSLTGLCEDYCTCIESYGHKVYKHLQTHHNEIERESQAVLSFAPDVSTIQISGQSFSVAIAKSVMERLRYSLEGGDGSSVNKLLVATTTTTLHESGGGGGGVGGSLYHGDEYNQHTAVIHTLSPGGESSHDSCYDSDCSPTSSRRNSSHRLDADLHTDISRTTSDTLGEELFEDVKGSNGDLATISDKSQPVKGYTSKVEFALKLGYTESQIGSVLDKLGANVDQNELLSELIKLGSSQESVSWDKKPSQNNSTRVSGGVSVVQSVHSSDLHSDKSRAHAPLQQKSSGSHRDDPTSNLRPIVIDGSNVAMSHGNKEVFSCQGIKLAVDFFKHRGHTEVTAFVPQWRKETSRNDNPITDQEMLYDLEREKILVFTPARRVGGKRVICYDDRYIVKLAAENGGIVVSNDNYRDLLNESPEFKEVIEQRLLMYSFVNDRFMPPDDPMGRHGPSLEQFLQKEPILQEPLPPVCPYGKKCTYGNKCKYYHPERGSAPHKSVTDRLKEEAGLRLKQAKEKGLLTSTNSIGDPRSLSGQTKKPLSKTKSLVQSAQPKRALTRTRSLVPGTVGMGPEAGGPYQKLEVDKLDINRSNSPASSRSLSPSLTVTPAPLDGIKSGDHGRKSNHASPRRSPSPRDLLATAPGRLDSVLKMQQEHLSVVHEVLRPVLSDPTSGFHKNQVTGHRMNTGHRIMDMGGEELTLIDANGVPRTYLDQGPFLTKAASVSEVNEAEGQALHRRLQRQLSLKGAEDPRILHKAKSRENVPTFKFHGTPVVPLGPMVQQQAQAWPAQQQQTVQYVDPYRLAMYQHMQAKLDAELQQKNQVLSGMQQPESEAPLNRNMNQLNTTLMPPEAMRSHLPLGKMPSAPGAFVQSENRVETGSTRRMNRQNSTSDSSLHQSKDAGNQDNDSAYPGIFGDPRWAFQGSIGGQRGPESFEQNIRQDPHSTYPPDSFFLSPDGSKHLQHTTEGLSRPGIKVEFGSERQAFVPPGRATPGAPANAVGHSGKSSEQHRPAARGHQGLQRTASRNTAATTSAGNMPLLVGTHTNTAQVSPGGTGQVVSVSRGAPPPGPTPAVSEKKDPVQLSSLEKSEQVCPPEQQRHQIYFHLCGLFDEKKVLQVMTAHPEETNPQVLCAYLIGMN